MNVIVINPMGQPNRLINVSKWKVGDKGQLDLYDGADRVFLTVAMGGWAGVHDEDAVKDHTAQVTDVGSLGAVDVSPIKFPARKPS